MDQQQQDPYSWRDSASAGGSGSAEDPNWLAKNHKLREKLPPSAKFPKHNMHMKARVLEDLLSKFKKNPNGLLRRVDCCEGSINDKLHSVKKSVPKARRLFHKNTLNDRVKIFKEQESIYGVSNLVTELKSSKFKITSDSQVDFNIVKGVNTMSCYDKIPRVPVDILEDGNSLESRPDVTQKLENISIECDFI
ncbi:hypothetical protein QAD02_022727 [Eretmocerus hayati]|uniref:Uncharacterized protein n=1 Tax=Eretmocerus hayati TaxID=131215 RepID=A0ACC2PTY1_9HYME|nr:hypothetical protein QAD02_022727 [Eretmocerus hayati]